MGRRARYVRTCVHMPSHAKSSQAKPTVIPDTQRDVKLASTIHSHPHTFTCTTGRRVLRVRQTPATTLVQSSVPGEDAEALAAELRDYFQLQEPLTPLYDRWAAGDGRMKAVAHHIPGVRVIR